MIFNRIFRERALQRRARQEPLDDRLQITAPHEWLIIAGLAVALVTLVVFGVCGRVDRTVSYDAVLTIPGERHYLVAPVSGTVTDVLVDRESTVEPGQPIAYVQPSQTHYLESALVRSLGALEEGGQLPEGNRFELLQELLTANLSIEVVSAAVITSPEGGEVMTLDLAPGQMVPTGALVGLVRAGAATKPEVVTFVSSDAAARLRAGMQADVIVGSPGEGRQVLQGRVAHVSASPTTPPKWLSGQGLDIPQQPYQLRVALVGDESDLPTGDGIGATLRIVVGRESVASLLTPGSSH